MVANTALNHFWTKCQTFWSFCMISAHHMTKALLINSSSQSVLLIISLGVQQHRPLSKCLGNAAASPGPAPEGQPGDSSSFHKTEQPSPKAEGDEQSKTAQAERKSQFFFQCHIRAHRTKGASQLLREFVRLIACSIWDIPWTPTALHFYSFSLLHHLQSCLSLWPLPACVDELHMERAWCCQLTGQGIFCLKQAASVSWLSTPVHRTQGRTWVTFPALPRGCCPCGLVPSPQRHFRKFRGVCKFSQPCKRDFQ